MTNVRRLAIAVALLGGTIWAQVSGSQSKGSGPVLDTAAIVKETQQTDNRNGKIGIFWLVPTEFWVQSTMNSGTPRERAQEVFSPLAKYNMFLIAIGKLRAGGVDWEAEDAVRRNVILRDDSGHAYKPVDDVSRDAQDIANLMAPAFKNVTGPMAEGIHIVFFPKTDASGKELTDPSQHASISLEVSSLMEAGTATYTWRFPFTSLSPPRYCPVGKERVDASWKYCPWHGIKLDPGMGSAAPSKQP